MTTSARTQRQIVIDAMQARPDFPWLRGEGHVPMGVPGRPVEQKAWLEPGGNFSPAPGSFGVSLWIFDADGRRIASSDAIPFPDIEQRYEWPDAEFVPALSTKTPFYRNSWRLDRDGAWHGEWKLSKKVPGRSAAVMVRSVGPAGGPVESLHWDGRRLTVNRRWIVEFDGARVAASLGDERSFPLSGEIGRAHV